MEQKTYFCTMNYLLIALGAISLVVGVVGIFVPLLPTTPFLLLTAALWAHSSPRFYAWLMNHRYFGEYIRNYRENRAIPLKTKIVTLILLWGTISYCILSPLWGTLWAQIALGVVVIGVTWHILSFKTLK